MYKAFILTFVVILAGAGSSYAGDNTPTNVIPPKDDYGCHRSPDDGHIYCACEGTKACDLMDAEEVCDREVTGEDGTDFTMNDTECFDDLGVCVCRAERTTRPGADLRPERATTPTTVAPRENEDITAPNNRTQRQERVRARRGSPAEKSTEKVAREELADGPSQSSVRRRIAEMVAAGRDGGPGTESFDEADSLLGRRTELVAAERGQLAGSSDEGDQSSEDPVGMVSIHSDEAPPEVLGIEEGDNVTDHREPGRDGVTDHREPGKRPSREPRPTPRPHTDPEPEASDKPATGLKGGLGAPTDLTVSEITRTTLTLSWRDNSTHEFGVEVYRIDPVRARRDRSTEWEFIGNFEERIDSRVKGFGMRSDEDFDLTPDTNYCYRIRAYRGFDRAAVSLYSETACAKTAP